MPKAFLLPQGKETFTQSALQNIPSEFHNVITGIDTKIPISDSVLQQARIMPTKEFDFPKCIKKERNCNYESKESVLLILEDGVQVQMFRAGNREGEYDHTVVKMLYKTKRQGDEVHYFSQFVNSDLDGNVRRIFGIEYPDHDEDARLALVWDSTIGETKPQMFNSHGDVYYKDESSLILQRNVAYPIGIASILKEKPQEVLDVMALLTQYPDLPFTVDARNFLTFTERKKVDLVSILNAAKDLFTALDNRNEVIKVESLSSKSVFIMINKAPEGIYRVDIKPHQNGETTIKLSIIEETKHAIAERGALYTRLDGNNKPIEYQLSVKKQREDKQKIDVHFTVNGKNKLVPAENDLEITETHSLPAVMNILWFYASL